MHWVGYGVQKGGVHFFNHSLKEKNMLENGGEGQIYCSTFLIKSFNTMEGSLVRYWYCLVSRNVADTRRTQHLTSCSVSWPVRITGAEIEMFTNAVV